MVLTVLPYDERLRLSELHGLNVLDTPAEPVFDDYACLARSMAGVPIALISLVDKERQWFKACAGLDVRETSREVSFCAHAILQDRVMWIEDARQDVRFADNPLVTGDPHIRFYAGAPLVVRDSRIGTLCIIGDKPKIWDAQVASQLTILARLVSERLESRRELDRRDSLLQEYSEAVISADADGLTTIWNPAAEKLLGYGAREVLGRPLRSILPVKEADGRARVDRQFRVLVDEVTDYAIYMLDSNGMVTSWNAGAKRIKGFSADEIVGRHFSCFYTQEDREAGKPALALRQARAGGRFSTYAWRVRKDGSRFWASVVMDPIYDDGQFVGFAKITRDLTERHEAETALEFALQQADAANRAKSEFLANMSHEIRTPLNGVVGVADMLMRSGLSERQQEMAQIISSSARTLEHLIGDILDLARIESGQTELSLEPFELADAIATTTGLIRLRAEERGLGFSSESLVDPGVWVVGDRLRLQQILTNLLGNAVKFTPAGHVNLTVHEEAGSNGPPVFRFEVSDTGIGFDPSQKGSIFGRFQQADGSITRRFGGTGLGMAISQQLAKMMGATLDCDSSPGRGSTFFLRVPLPTCAPPDAGETPIAPDATSPERPIRVLLADDHPTNRKVCELILSQIDAEVVSVEDGAQAVEAFEADRFDVVLMDMQMPVMDGLSAVRAIRGLEVRTGALATPIFMLTANALAEHVEQARHAGADRHIAKPVTAAALFDALSGLSEPFGKPQLNPHTVDPAACAAAR